MIRCKKCGFELGLSCGCTGHFECPRCGRVDSEATNLRCPMHNVPLIPYIPHAPGWSASNTYKCPVPECWHIIHIHKIEPFRFE